MGRKMNAIDDMEGITVSKIKAATDRYCKFLYLMKKDGYMGEKRMSVPGLDVDLIWHSHQIDAVQYVKMCQFMFPNDSDALINHDDSICFKKIMEKYRKETQRRWIDAFGSTDYFKGRIFGNKLVFDREGYVIKDKSKIDVSSKTLSEEKKEVSDQMASKKRKLSKHDNEDSDSPSPPRKKSKLSLDDTIRHLQSIKKENDEEHESMNWRTRLRVYKKDWMKLAIQAEDVVVDK